MWTSLAQVAGDGPYVLANGRLLTDVSAAPRRADIRISVDGTIERIGERLAVRQEVGRVDLAGALVVPGFVDAHQHLDKTGVLKFAPNPSGTLQGARDAFALYAR